jgi:RHH-type proline utilization regulon transcriptional repressor/proline dehydrogenase/delta 1-pyrroline-5-carboxylate dehydrogenase
VPRTALQFVPCSGATVGQQLVSHDAVDAVVLTGGTATALEMLRRKPTMRLLAETGGKNATIVTALSDRDLAIKNVLHSSFSHSGQKCSATSLLILEEEVYHDAKFRDMLVDAVESLRVGSAWDLPTKINPLIRPPSGDLERALKELEPGESWAVMPRLHVDGNPHLVSPGVKWGAQSRSVTHCTEFFGPMLGVMSAKNLHEAIDLVNATGYGLTSGLESLDDREHQTWQDGVRAGNLYINRPTTGAIVLRQPFGGMGKSAFGPGIKAGGPNYVAALMGFEDGEETGVRGQESVKKVAKQNSKDSPDQARQDEADPPWRAWSGPGLASLRRGEGGGAENLKNLRDGLSTLEHGRFPSNDAARLLQAMDSYLHWMAEEFGIAHDHFRLIGEDNFRRYLPVSRLRIRVHEDDTPFDVFARAAAARAVGCHTVVSAPLNLTGSARDSFDLLDQLTDSWAAAIEFVEESNEQLAEAMRSRATERVRYADPLRVPKLIRRAAAESYVYIADAPVRAHGRVELLWHLQEQSLSHVYHRYGNLGRRAEEVRAPVT